MALDTSMCRNMIRSRGSTAGVHGAAERDPAEYAEQRDYGNEHGGPQARWLYDHDKHDGQEGRGYRVRHAPQDRVKDPPAQLRADRPWISQR